MILEVSFNDCNMLIVEATGVNVTKTFFSIAAKALPKVFVTHAHFHFLPSLIFLGEA